MWLRIQAEQGARIACGDLGNPLGRLVVQLREGCQAEVAELQAWVRERLRSSRTPERIEFWDELPYNETGKLLRRVVRAELVGDG